MCGGTNDMTSRIIAVVRLTLGLMSLGTIAYVRGYMLLEDLVAFFR